MTYAGINTSLTVGLAWWPLPLSTVHIHEIEAGVATRPKYSELSFIYIFEVVVS